MDDRLILREATRLMVALAILGISSATAAPTAKSSKMLAGAEFVFEASAASQEIRARRVRISGPYRRFDYFPAAQIIGEPSETSLNNMQNRANWLLDWKTKTAYQNPEKTDHKTEAGARISSPKYVIQSQETNVPCSVWKCRYVTVADTANGLVYEAMLSRNVPELKLLLVLQAEATAHLSPNHIQAHLTRKWPGEAMIALQSRPESESATKVPQTAAIGSIRLISAKRGQWPAESFELPKDFKKASRGEAPPPPK